METSTIVWEVSGTVSCPYCTKDNDFMDRDEWYYECSIGETKEFERPYLMSCKHCHKEFKITNSEY